MTVQKISTLAELATINAGDYILVSEDAGGGSYTSKKYDLSGLVAKAEKDADAVAGNLSIFDADGNSVDSGYKPADMFGAAEAVQLNLDRYIGTTDVLPTLDLQFPPNGGDERFFDFARSSIGTRVNAMGLIETLGSDEVRYDYDPVTGAYLGPLIEPQSTNLCLQSEDLSTSWGNVRSTENTNAAVAPDGNTTADELVEEVTVATNHQLYQNITVVADTNYCVSVFAKANTRSDIQIHWAAQSGAGNGYLVGAFDLSAGTKGTATAANGGTVVDSDIEDCGNGWYRCWISGKFNATETDGRIVLYLSNGTSVSYDGDGTSGLYLWGAQVEAVS